MKVWIGFFTINMIIGLKFNNLAKSFYSFALLQIYVEFCK